MSDLHLEVSFCGSRDVPGYDAFDCKPFAPVLALLGDIGLVTQEKLFGFLRCQLLKYEKVFFVMGNHEFYHSSYVSRFLSPSLPFVMIGLRRRTQNAR